MIVASPEVLPGGQAQRPRTAHIPQEVGMHYPKSDTVRTELVRAFRDRYRTASRKGKRIILNELITLTGYHPKAAIRALNAEPQMPKARSRHRNVSMTLRHRVS